jgi:hypothetical protein
VGRAGVDLLVEAGAGISSHLQLATHAVTASKIAASAVTAAAISPDAVTTSTIEDDAVGTDQLEPGSVTGSDVDYVRVQTTSAFAALQGRHRRAPTGEGGQRLCLPAVDRRFALRRLA